MFGVVEHTSRDTKSLKHKREKETKDLVKVISVNRMMILDNSRKTEIKTCLIWFSIILSQLVCVCN